jgi:hypothetical protein
LCFPTPILSAAQQKLPEKALPHPEFFAGAGKSDLSVDASNGLPRIATLANNHIYFR